MAKDLAQPSHLIERPAILDELNQLVDTHRMTQWRVGHLLTPVRIVSPPAGEVAFGSGIVLAANAAQVGSFSLGMVQSATKSVMHPLAFGFAVASGAAETFNFFFGR